MEEIAATDAHAGLRDEGCPRGPAGASSGEFRNCPRGEPKTVTGQHLRGVQPTFHPQTEQYTTFFSMLVQSRFSQMAFPFWTLRSGLNRE